MRQKIATLLIRVSAVVTVAAVAVMIFGPVIWLEFPDVSLWALIYAVMAIWSFSPEHRPYRELWLFGICRLFITVWELIDVHFFTEDPHPATQVGLWILLCGSVLYVIGLAFWSTHSERKTAEESE